MAGAVPFLSLANRSIHLSSWALVPHKFRHVALERCFLRQSKQIRTEINNSHRIQVLKSSLTELQPPPIDNDLLEVMREMGAQLSEDGVVTSFGNDHEAIEAADSGVAVVDMSHFGRLRVTGEDRIRFLHNQSTADFQSLKNGQGCDTVFTTATGRTVELATAYVMNTAVIVVVSDIMRHSTLNMLQKYIFFADKVEIEDITTKTHLFSVVGPSSDELMKKLNLGDIIGKPFGTHLHYAVEGTPVMVAVGSGLSSKGFTLMLSTSTANSVWIALLREGAVPMGAAAWERLRILQGRPLAGKELTDEFNVLEAGLWKAVSLTKGCYIGQETIARLITYNGVKQELWGVQLENPTVPGTIVTFGVRKIGKVTSCTTNGSGYFALAYIRKQEAKAGVTVEVGEHHGILVDIPFVRRSHSKE